MNLRLKIITIILVIIAVIIGFFRFMPQKTTKNPQRNYFMGVDGDPRMRVCNSALDAPDVNQVMVKSLKINGPLQLNDKDKAIYRISVFQTNGEKAVSIEFKTPKTGAPGIVNVGTFNKGVTQFESQDLIYEQALALIGAFQAAQIWGKSKPTFLPKKIVGPAISVIEINAPKEKRCVTTRYDDERIAELLREFAKRVSSVVTKTDISSFAPPKTEMFGKEVK